MHKLETLCANLLDAKKNEDLAEANRIAIEQEIIGIVGLPVEGSKTHDAEGYKVRVEQKINRKLDNKAWAVIKDRIPEQLRPVKYVEEIKLEPVGVRWLMMNEPGYYRLLCTAMEEKPAKPAVKVEVV